MRKGGILPIIVVVVIMILVVGGYLFVQNQSKQADQTSTTTTGESQQTTTPTESGDLQYPNLYKQANLPEYSKANLVDTGRQTTSIRDGLKLQLTSKESVQTIATYYEGEMKNLGWYIPEQKFPNEQVYSSQYTKGDLYYQMTVTKFPDEIKITINYAQN